MSDTNKLINGDDLFRDGAISSSVDLDNRMLCWAATDGRERELNEELC